MGKGIRDWIDDMRDWSMTDDDDDDDDDDKGRKSYQGKT